MADHQQQQILDAVQALLVTANTAAGANVFVELLDSLQESQLPAIHIEGGDEDINNDSLNSPAYQLRAYQFTTACIVAGTGKDARNLAAQIEVALFASPGNASGKANTLVLTGSEVRKDGSGAIPLFEVQQKWQAQYITRAGIPDALA